MSDDRNSVALSIASAHCSWAKREGLRPAEVMIGLGLVRTLDNQPPSWDEAAFRLAALWLELSE